MFTKVKHNTKGEVEIGWRDEREDTGESIECKLTSLDPPRPEFLSALQSFCRYVVEICSLPSDYKSEMTITGVSFSFSESLGDGLVVTALKSVNGANSPVVINTPFLSEGASCEGGPRWPAYLLQLVQNLRAEADMYRKGKRAQQELELEATA